MASEFLTCHFPVGAPGIHNAMKSEFFGTYAMLPGQPDKVAAAASMGWPEGALEDAKQLSRLLPSNCASSLAATNGHYGVHTQVSPQANDADDMMFDAVLAEILTAPTKLGQSNCMAMQMDSNTDSSGNLAMLLGDMELKNRPASCTISNPASMSSFSTAVDSSQSVLFQPQSTPFERGSARRATVTMGSLRRARPNTAPYSKTTSLNGSAVTSPVIGNQHLMQPAPFVPQMSNIPAHDVWKPLLGESDSNLLLQYKIRNDTLQRRNTINLGRYDVVSHEAMRARSHSDLDTWIDPSMGVMGGNTIQHTIQEQNELRRLLATQIASTPSDRDVFDRLLGARVNDIMETPAEGHVPHNAQAATASAQGRKGRLSSITANIVNKLGRRISRGDKHSSPESFTDEVTATPSEMASGDSFDDKDNKKRKRRTFAELNRDIQCPVVECARVYASAHSLQQHIRLKHVDVYLAQKEMREKKQQQQSAAGGGEAQSAIPSPGAEHGSDNKSATLQKKGSMGSFLEHDILGRLGLGKRSSSSSPAAGYYNHTSPTVVSPMDFGLTDPQSPLSGEIGFQRPASTHRCSSMLLTTDSILEELLNS